MPAFKHEVVAQNPLPDMEDHLLIEVTPYLERQGYKLETQTRTGFIYRRSVRRTWVYFVCVLLFPIGLLALLAEKEEHRLTVTLRAVAGSRTRVSFSGDDVSPMLAEAIRELN